MKKSYLLALVAAVALMFPTTALAESGKKLFQQYCSYCHSPTLVKYHKGYDAKLWAQVIDRMKLAPVPTVKNVLVISNENRDKIAKYLEMTYK